MCGIAGFLHRGEGMERPTETIEAMLSQLRHRGPDEAGYYIDDRVALGTARLSVIDLHSGSQPICDQDERYWISYNGEIYNYIELRDELEQLGCLFHTASDTEVLLQAWIHWGPQALQRCNGAFAFAIYDTQQSSLFLARDRFGKRPLFYAEHDGAFVFASEMKSFFALRGFSFEQDTSQLAAMYSFWTPLPEQTGFQNVHQLPMGEYLTVDGNGLTRHQYYQLDLSAEAFDGDVEEAADAVREAMDESVRLRLRSDVDVGVYLSGGLDSTVLTDIVARRASKSVYTFSVEFEASQFDESTDQKLVADRYETNHRAIHINARDITENMPAALYHAEVPVFRTAFVPMFMLSKMVEDVGVKVVLSGEGADEAFLGYNIFKETLIRQAWGSLSNEERKQKLAQIYPYLKHYSSENMPQLLGLYQHYSQEHTHGLFSHEMRFNNAQFTQRLLKHRHDPEKAMSRLLDNEPDFFDLSAVQKAQWLEFKTLLAGYLLSTQGDRMAMAHGVENRCPFLDPKVVALAAAVNLRFDDGFDEKFPLKHAFAGRIPESMLRKPKRPYMAPDVEAFSQNRPDYLELLLSNEELSKIGFLNPKFCTALTRKVLSVNPETLSVKENHAFIFLVSTALLHQFFVQRKGLPNAAPQGVQDILVKVVDHRTA